MRSLRSLAAAALLAALSTAAFGCAAPEGDAAPTAADTQDLTQLSDA